MIGPYLADKKTHLKENVKPLQAMEETVYVLKNSDAADHVAKRFPNKKTKHVRNSLRPRSVDGFRQGLPLVFQPNKSKGLDATYHFTFTGKDQGQISVVIRGKKLIVAKGHIGNRRLACDRRQRDLVRLSCEGKESRLGVAAKEDSYERIAKTAHRLREVFSVMSRIPSQTTCSAN